MARESIQIENFAGIRELELELSRINVLIGPQATGKSVVAKLLYFFKDFPTALAENAAAGEPWEELEKTLAKRFKSYFPPSSWGSDPARLRYEQGGLHVELSIRDREIELGCSSAFMDRHHEISRGFEEALEKENAELRRWPAQRRRTVELKILKEIAEENRLSQQRFIPASRSSLAQLRQNLFTFLSAGKLQIDLFVQQFGMLYERVKPALLELQGSEAKNVNELLEGILGGRYAPVGEEDFLAHRDGRQIRITEASSGQQEAFPLAIILADLLSLDAKTASEVVTYIEEPEAHLFPTAQRDIVNLVATVFNLSKARLQFFITTHSPYILTSLNNLLEAGQLYSTLEGEKLEALREIVPEEQAIKPSDVAAYVLEGGSARSIFDEESQLIAGHEIDAVSDELGLVFDRLLDLAPEQA